MDDLTTDETALMEHVPLDGTSIGNTTLRRDLLAWNEEKYWPVRDSLVAKGQLGLVRGRGGGVRRAMVTRAVLHEGSGSVVTGMKPEEPKPTAGSVETTAVAPSTPQLKGEIAYYADIANTLQGQWAKSVGLDNFLIQVTALQGRRETGGAWSRPDIVFVNVTNFRYVPGRHLDVITFEVKRVDDADVKAVYEALAHLRRATKSYLIIVGPGVCTEEDLERISGEARQHGIGLIIAKDEKDMEKWEFMCEPERADTDPAGLDEFLEGQLDEENKRKLSLWVK